MVSKRPPSLPPVKNLEEPTGFVLSLNCCLRCLLKKKRSFFRKINMTHLRWLLEWTKSSGKRKIKKKVNLQKNYVTWKINSSKFFHVFLAAKNEFDNKIWHLAIFWPPFWKNCKNLLFYVYLGKYWF